jgi:hypothetical protein
MEQAINTYQSLTVSSEFKEAERMRELALHNEAAALRHAASQRNIEIAKNAIQMKLPIESIVKLTGLSQDEVEKLQKQITKRRKSLPLCYFLFLIFYLNQRPQKFLSRVLIPPRTYARRAATPARTAFKGFQNCA